MANSGTVTAGSAALASQYNNLRDDVLNVTTGHTHTGASENGAKVAATGISSGTAANGAVLTADGSGASAFLAAGASGGILKYEEFTSSGSFVIPANASSSAIVVLEMISGGNGGNGGSNRASAVEAKGGNGGSGGRRKEYVNLVSAFGAAGGTVTVTIGAGGAGGTGQSATGIGGVGSVGGYTSFGSATAYAQPSTTIGFSPSSFQLNIATNHYGKTGADTQGSGTALFGTGLSESESGEGGFADVNSYSAPDNSGGGAGGGAGGGIGSDNVAGTASKGGKRYELLDQHIVSTGILVGNGAAAGTASGGAGGTAASSGGGGGGSRTNGNGGAGGAGAQPGCGGGGGGATRSGFTSGAGGAGGAGRVRVWVIG